MTKDFFELNDQLEGEKRAILLEAYAEEAKRGMDVTRCIECGEDFNESNGDSIFFCSSACRNGFHERENIEACTMCGGRPQQVKDFCRPCWEAEHD